MTCWPARQGALLSRIASARQAHRSLPGKWLVSLRATSLGPDGYAWIVVIEQFATSMCRYVEGPTRSVHATAARTTASWVNTTTVAASDERTRWSKASATRA